MPDIFMEGSCADGVKNTVVDIEVTTHLVLREWTANSPQRSEHPSLSSSAS